MHHLHATNMKNMRVESLLALVFFAPFRSCTDGIETETTAELNHPEGRMHRAKAEKGLLDFDTVQRTCALYVAIRSHAIEASIGFGQELDDVAIHWNMCPSGNMVACAKVPTANGDSTLTGIPFPY